ncbi:hypothetical protein GE21DRAFT_8216 [Neurospora crassa]|uniref:Uncharacterized protein n=2 Tax=Neurospora crassa (strain ATCC 24698 / 74-OR23-1A / CBS 708.71 / DSM 1257 / FGSC 987) TaxID=367110 RepID=V5ILP0_NEUCR|nr:hypothetical protein NCU04224 [Neurospora crassa OR74A]ESA42673.1 hypothetical protein NCU04224 [Neurospora crassa OR74A]KHE86073.1 hypothetical protein GE21DRAFT_8216 [Neurospora crassa]|eukprot:XP_011394638.1 hypothetical protein NCU04224 [Neurospora crassa OR74A]
MAVFVDLEDEDVDPGQVQPSHHGLNLPARNGAGTGIVTDIGRAKTEGVGSVNTEKHREEAHEPAVRENPNQNSMTLALGCYPIVMSLAASIDLNTLDNLSRTCRQIRGNLLQYRKMLLVSTLHCSNEDLPIDPDAVLRYRARTVNWFYMQELGRSNKPCKVGQCARDLVGGCRRCGTVVCRNCAIKPPAPIVLRDRHRRLCVTCAKTPIGNLTKPPLGREFSVESDDVQRAICRCDTDGVWLCQPCGKTIRNDDYDYKSIWRWRNQYTDVLGGLGTGIGEGDRGVICGRGSDCCAARKREQEIDCDAEDAQEADGSYVYTPSPSTTTVSNDSTISMALWGTDTASTTSSNGSVNGSNASSSSQTGGLGSTLAGPSLERRTPSPMLKPGYDRHEIEGIGGVVKKKLVRMVKVGACVPEWPDERDRGDILGREMQAKVRSWCGWCWRVIPGKLDYEFARQETRSKALEEK